jgi:hypothetical protein
MEFGLDKLTGVVLQRGKLFHSQNITPNFNREIQDLEQGKTQKYLGNEENDGIQN